MMLWNRLQLSSGLPIAFLFGNKRTNLSHYLQNLLLDSDELILVIDNKRTWRGEGLGNNIKILQPTNKVEFFDILFSLPLYINPKLEYIVIDYLPMFFRDAGVDSFTNAREYALTLTVLQKTTSSLKILVTSYASGIDPKAPIFPEITKYYFSKGHLVTSINPYTIEICKW